MSFVLSEFFQIFFFFNLAIVFNNLIDEYYNFYSNYHL